MLIIVCCKRLFNDVNLQTIISAWRLRLNFSKNLDSKSNNLGKNLEYRKKNLHFERVFIVLISV